MIMTSRSLLCWALWIFADGDSVRPPISTLQYSHNKPALLELADCPRTLHPRGHMISPEGGRTAQTLLPGKDPPPRGAITRPNTEASHVAVLPGFIFSTPKSLLDFFDSLLHPVSDEILILCELFLLSATEAETTNSFSLQLVKFSSLFGDRTLQTMMLFLAHLRNI